MRSARPAKAPTPPPPSRNGAATDFAPVPRRTTRPKWLDPRIIGGILLVIAAVVIGARVIGASAHTTKVWAAAHDLAAGTVVAAGDLVGVDVNLGDAADHYLRSDQGDTALIGRSVASPVRSGELLPAGVLDQPVAGRVIVIGVDADRMPPGVAHGSKIDLYLTVGGGAASQSAAKTDLIASGITVQGVTAPSSGGLSGASSNQYQVAVLLDSTTADRLIRVLPTGEPIIALVSGR